MQADFGCSIYTPTRAYPEIDALLRLGDG